MKEVFVLDACALVALLMKEKGWDIVADIYQQANNGNVLLYMNRINLLEVYYGFYRDRGKEYASNIITSVEESSVLINEFDSSIFQEAGRLKAMYKISLADSIVVAQTIILNGSIITSDHHELRFIEGKENLHFTWIR